MNRIAKLFLLKWVFGQTLKKEREPVMFKFFIGVIVVTMCRVLYPTSLDVPQIFWSDVEQGKLIGKGSFGDVYGGTCQGQEVAIKVLQIRTLSTPQIQREFDEEVRIMWECQFPRILRLYGVCTEPGHCAMVFERMEGSLYDLIHSDAVIPEEKRLQIALDISQGLANLHGKNVIHRDLKSHNILLDKRGRVKICDFGLAKLRTRTSTFTAGGAAGTVRWCAPELLDESPRLTPAADIYSYGMILWELLARKVPFEEQPREHVIINKVLSGKREVIPSNCPLLWKEMIEACWQQDPGLRPGAEVILAKFTALKPPKRSVWLPEEDPHPSAVRAGGFALYPASGKDWQKVLDCYRHHVVPGYVVGKVEVIFNPSMNQRFAAQRELLQQRQGNPRYKASWKQDRHGNLREGIDKHLETLAEPYQDDDYPDVKLIPLWHGTQKGKLDSLLSAGYTPFGDTDDGYFGKGVYATHEAAYAQMYANKFAAVQRDDCVLLLNWGITYASYPIIKQDYNPIGKRLAHRVEPGKYDTHFIPVVAGTQPGDYVPITPPERHEYTEMVFLEASQILPRYRVTLEPTENFQEFLKEKALREKEELKKKEEEASRQRAAKEEKRKEEVARLAVSASPAKQIPGVAKGYEAIYERFLKGKIIYRPKGDGKDEGKIELRIADLGNALEGTFDLSRCGDAGQYLSISTGYRKVKKAENASKVEIWLAPRFLIEKNVATTAGHFQGIMGGWDGAAAPVGIFWTWGGWDNMGWYDYLTTNNMDEVGSENLYEKYKKSPGMGGTPRTHPVIPQLCVLDRGFSCSFCELK